MTLRQLRTTPVRASSTLATWSYRLGFGSLLPQFGPGAAVGDILIVIALVFGLLHIRVQRRQESPAVPRRTAR